MKREPNKIAEAKEVCACCKKLKTCGLYGLQDGSTAWVCLECREGRK